MPAWNQGGFGEGGFGDDAVVIGPPIDYTPPAIDHVALALSRVITQYQASTKLLTWITALMQVSNEQENALQSLLYLADPAIQNGVNLDTIGRLVGTTRYVQNAVALPFFGFQDTPDGQPFGEEGQPQFGSRFYEEGEPSAETNVLGDVEFRLVIGAQILKNASRATPEDMLSALAFLFQTDSVNLIDEGTMSYTASVGRQLTATEKILLSSLQLLPQPAGVGLDGIVSFDPANYFGFSDQPNALGFGEEGQANVGGIFAEEIL